MSFHHLYHGGYTTQFRQLYPQNMSIGAPDDCAGNCPIPSDPNAAPDLDVAGYEVAGHKTEVAFGISRTLDFYPALVDDSYELNGNCVVAGQANSRIQIGLQQYLKCFTIAEDDVIGMSIIPAESVMIGTWVKVESAEAGVSFDVIEQRSGAVIGSVDASTTGTYWFPTAAADQFHVGNRLVALEVKAWPTELPKNLRITVSPVVFAPDTGN